MASILFIEDDPDAGFLYERVCSMLGYQFILGNSGNQGIKLAKERLPDMIVLDLSLPDLNGIAVVKKLRQNPLTAHIPVAIISASTDEELQKAYKASGVEAFMEKPIDISEFMKLTAELIPPTDG